MKRLILLIPIFVFALLFSACTPQEQHPPQEPSTANAVTTNQNTETTSKDEGAGCAASFDMWYYIADVQHFMLFRSTGTHLGEFQGEDCLFLDGVIEEDLCGEIEVGTSVSLPIKLKVYNRGIKDYVTLDTTAVEEYLKQTENWIIYLYSKRESDTLQSIRYYSLTTPPGIFPVVDGYVRLESRYEMLEAQGVTGVWRYETMYPFTDILNEGMPVEQALNNLREYVKESLVINNTVYVRPERDPEKGSSGGVYFDVADGSGSRD